MPHIGAQTVEAQKRVAQYTLNNLFNKIKEMGI
jgi:D-3-phosphoglycerate dehydrogenase